jgi:hypothetical protein
MRIAVLSGQGPDVQAAWIAVAGWPGGWALEVSAAWPSPSGPGPDPSAGRSPRTGGVRPTGRSRGPPCPSAGQPLPGCPQEELIGGDGVQAGVRRRHPGGSRAASRTAACPARQGGVLEVPRVIEGWVGGPTSGSGAEACFRHRSGRWTRVGGWVSGYRRAARVCRRWGRAGALLGGGWSRRGLIGSRRANRSARLAGVEPNIKKPIGHTPLAK